MFGEAGAAFSSADRPQAVVEGRVGGGPVLPTDDLSWNLQSAVQEGDIDRTSNASTHNNTDILCLPITIQH